MVTMNAEPCQLAVRKEGSGDND